MPFRALFREYIRSRHALCETHPFFPHSHCPTARKRVHFLKYLLDRVLCYQKTSFACQTMLNLIPQNSENPAAENVFSILNNRSCAFTLLTETTTNKSMRNKMPNTKRVNARAVMEQRRRLSAAERSFTMDQYNQFQIITDSQDSPISLIWTTAFGYLNIFHHF